MMSLNIEESEVAISLKIRSQQRAAKIAGSMILLLILLYFAEQLIALHNDPAITRKKTELIVNPVYLISTLVLIYTLYRVLKPVNKKLAFIAMIWRLGEAFIIFIMMIFSFESKANTIGFNISSILFSMGSFIFFYLFFKSKYIPGAISVFGIFASVLVTIVCFATLIFPNYSEVIQFGWIPILMAEITLGFCLLFKGLRLSRQAHLNLANQ